MATFQYEALDAKGQEVKAEIEALNNKEAISKIRNHGLLSHQGQGQGWRRQRRSTKEAGPAKKRGAGGKVKVKLPYAVCTTAFDASGCRPFDSAFASRA